MVLDDCYVCIALLILAPEIQCLGNGILSRYGDELRVEWLWFESQQGQDIQYFRTGSKAYQSSYLWLPGGSFTGN
jgi:hypothetical protein